MEPPPAAALCVYNHNPDNAYKPSARLVTLEVISDDTTASKNTAHVRIFSDGQAVYNDPRSNAIIASDKIRGIWEDIKSLFITLWEDIKNLFRPASEKNRCCDVGNTTEMEELDMQPLDEKKNMVFIIPGLNSRGTWGHLTEKKFKEKNEDLEVRVIKYPKRGNQPVTDSFIPIFNMIKKYCLANPNKPIAIIGTSLGGRLAIKLEGSLRKECPTSPIIVYSIAPAFASTYATRMNTQSPGLARLAVNKDLLDAFTLGSNKTDKLVASANEDLGEVTRKIVVVQASEDPLIDLSKALPNLKNQKNLTYVRKIAYGYRHLSVVLGTMDNAVKVVSSFFNQSKTGPISA